MKLTQRRILAVAIGSVFAFSANAAEMVKVEDGALLQQGLATAHSIAPSELGFKAKKTIVLPNGETKVRYQQTYYGVPVFNTSVVATSTELGPRKVYGRMLQGINADVATISSQINNDEAMSIAKQAFENKTLIASEKEVYQNEQSELMVMLDENSDAKLVYKVNFFVESDTPSRPYYFIDANSGEILKTWEGLAHSEEAGTGPGAILKLANIITAKTTMGLR